MGSSEARVMRRGSLALELPSRPGWGREPTSPRCLRCPQEALERGHWLRFQMKQEIPTAFCDLGDPGARAAARLGKQQGLRRGDPGKE